MDHRGRFISVVKVSMNRHSHRRGLKLGPPTPLFNANDTWKLASLLARLLPCPWLGVVETVLHAFFFTPAQVLRSLLTLSTIACLGCSTRFTCQLI